MTKKYKDIDGSEVRLEMLCSSSPRWAADRIRFLDNLIFSYISALKDRDTLLLYFRPVRRPPKELLDRIEKAETLYLSMEDNKAP